MAQRTPARPRVFFDIDIDDWRASHARAAAFVEATNLRYGLSTDRLQDLGGSERVRVRRDLYPNDYEWSSRGPIRMKPRREVSRRGIYRQLPAFALYLRCCILHL